MIRGGKTLYPGQFEGIRRFLFLFFVAYIQIEEVIVESSCSIREM